MTLAQASFVRVTIVTPPQENQQSSKGEHFRLRSCLLESLLLHPGLRKETLLIFIEY